MRRLESKTEGFVKIWRPIFEDRDFEVYPRAREVFIFLIVFAEWQDTNAMFRGSYRIVKRGQLICGYRRISEKLGLPLSTVQRSIKVLVDLKRIQVDSDAHGTLFTICNYSKYQDNPNNPTVSRNTNAYTDANRDANRDEYYQVRREESKKERREDLAPESGDPPLRGEDGGLAGEEDKGGEPREQTQLALIPETEGDGTEPSAENTARARGGDAERQVEQKPKETDEERAKRVELALWREGLYAQAKARYIQAGLDPAYFPRMDGKLSGRIATEIKRAGWGNLRDGTQLMLRAVMMNAEKYENRDPDTGEMRPDQFWFPTLNSMLTIDKLSRLLKESADVEWDEEIHFQAKAFADSSKELLRQWEDYYAENHGRPVKDH
jgi:hypothetical protein